MADENEDIDLEQIVWDPRYRRGVIERLNRAAGNQAPTPDLPRPGSEGAPLR